ncbi:hypothetical protein K0M31_005421 [Melipona bicolor]|uniref:Uncharacterized protein n=1 Tax=Melipona bicolor TaxID=60889 RepID=A0AA40FUZ5_9HYME|nr:hypothetical protein K0M31_005421 [Melipona bicolor]
MFEPVAAACVQVNLSPATQLPATFSYLHEESWHEPRFFEEASSRPHFLSAGIVQTGQARVRLTQWEDK